MTEFGIGDRWKKLEAKTGEVVCNNIGDLLMSWSDDRFKGILPRRDAVWTHHHFGDRYNIAYFNQPRKDALI